MESKDGVRAAFRQWNSAQRSPHRTSSFHHIRRSNQPCFYKCSISLATLSMDNSMVQPSAVRCCCLWNGWSIAPLPKPGCRHPDSASKPDVTLSRHPAPQWCGSCHEDHRMDGWRDCLLALHTYLGTSPGSCHMHADSPPSLPHHRSHVSVS